MKKKIIISTVAIILCVALIFSLTALAGDGFTNLETPVNAENLASSQIESVADSKESKKSVNAVDSDTKTVWKSSKSTDSLVLTFKEEQTFNTVVIREKGWKIKNFSLS